MTQENNRGFKGIWIPREIWLRDDLSLLDKALIAEVESLDRGEGCNASDTYLAEFFGISKSHLSNTLSALRERGLIETKAFDGRRRLLKQTAYNTSALLKTVEQPYEIQEPTLIRDNKEDISLAQPAAEVEKPETTEKQITLVRELLFTLDGIRFPERRAGDYSRLKAHAKAILASTPDCTREEFNRRVENYHKKWMKATISAAALAKWWPSLGEVTVKSTSTSDSIPHY